MNGQKLKSWYQELIEKGPDVATGGQWPGGGGQPLTYDFSVMTEKGVTTSSD
jgi:hypothetical protein